MNRLVALTIAASIGLLCFACSGDDNTSSSSSSGGSSSGGSSSGGSSSGSTTSTSSGSTGSTTTQKFSCKLNGSCYKCPTSAAVSTCFSKGPAESGCTSTDESFCDG